MIQEYCYTNGQWYQGVINTLGVKAATGSGLAATAYGVEVHGVGEAGVHIRVFYQGGFSLAVSKCYLFIQTVDRCHDQ